MVKLLDVIVFIGFFLIVNLVVVGAAWIIIFKDMPSIAILISIGIMYLIVNKK